MKQSVITCVVALLVVVAGESLSAQSTAADGEKVFAAQKCTICHAVGGQGNRKGPLDNVGAKWSADDIRMWITQAPVMAAKVKAERKPAMKAFTALSQEEVDALVAYLQTLKKESRSWERGIQRIPEGDVARVAVELHPHPAGDVAVADAAVGIGKAERAAGTRGAE